MQVTVHAAKTQLSKLIEAALAGEEVIIARGKQPAVKLVPVDRKPFQLGVMEAELKGSGPDFLQPLDEQSLREWEGAGE